MISSTPPETTSPFTPEPQLRLGRVYALILRWNREDDLTAPEANSSNPSEAVASTGDAEITGREE